MPCTGPSQKYAHERADEVADGFRKLLEHSYYIREPYGPFARNLKDDHNKAKAQLRAAIRELFWIEACDAF